MMNSNCIVALDFDGVICNSVDECLITSWNAFQSWRGNEKLISSSEEISASYLSTFRAARHVVRPAREFGLLWTMIEAGVTNIDDCVFASAKQTHSIDWNGFEQRYFEQRNRFRKNDPEGWLALHSQYPQATAIWHQLVELAPIYIVTTKDSESIRWFNQHWRLGIPENRYYTHNTGLNKHDSVMDILRRNHCPPERVYFVDDHPEHLKDVAPTNVNCRWASWGFHNHIGCNQYINYKSLADLVTEILANGSNP